MLELTNPAAALQRPGFLTRPLALPVNPWWALWVLAIGASWLLPTHFIPWRAFHSDLLMALALLPAAFWAALQSRDAMPLHASTLAVVLVACTPLLQLAAGMMYFAGDAWIASVYLFGFALALLVGARFEQLAPGRLVNALFFAIGMAAVLSAGLAVYQWLRLSGLGLLAVETTFARGYRPYANLGQPNHLSTLLVWGLVAVWWARVSGKIRGWPALVAAAWLLLGVAATQSRTGWLEVALLAVCAIIFRKPLRSRADAFGFVVLGAWFALLVSAWGALNRALHLDAPLSLAEQLLAGRRPLSWQIFGDALMRRPWSGWGWNQITIAHSSVAADHPALGYAFQSSHNFPLDLVVQLGLPLGGAIILGLAAWLCHKALRVHTAQGCLLLLAVAVLLVHSMLEFPQDYGYFLLPAGLMMGALDQQHQWGRVARFPRWGAALLLIAAAGLVAWVAVEYNLAERSLERVRFERNRVGPSRDSKAPELLMLTQLRDFQRFLRLNAQANTSPEQLEAMRRIALRYPSDGNQLIYAVAAGQNGQPDAARDTLVRLCRMVPVDRCTASLSVWRSMAATSPALSAIKVPSPP